MSSNQAVINDSEGGLSKTAMSTGNVRKCEGFQMPAVRWVEIFSGGRRRKTSKGGNRGRVYVEARRTLWGFDCADSQR
jgi:hypothetical protein